MVVPLDILWFSCTFVAEAHGQACVALRNHSDKRVDSPVVPGRCELWRKGQCRGRVADLDKRKTVLGSRRVFKIRICKCDVTNDINATTDHALKRDECRLVGNGTNPCKNLVPSRRSCICVALRKSSRNGIGRNAVAMHLLRERWVRWRTRRSKWKIVKTCETLMKNLRRNLLGKNKSEFRNVCGSEMLGTAYSIRIQYGTATEL